MVTLVIFNNIQVFFHIIEEKYDREKIIYSNFFYCWIYYIGIKHISNILFPKNNKVN